MRRDGIPISCEIWPGNTADVKTLTPILNALKKRFRIRKVVLVCDRGMVSAANLKALAEAGYEYIVGMRMRRNLEVREQVLRRAGPCREVKHNLHVKEVWVDERRYVVCCNPERAEKDRKDRQAILDKLELKLAHGNVKSLIPNVGYRRFLKSHGAGVAIDPQRVKDDERYDGKYVLRTNTELPAPEVAEAYRQLTWIERLWRELKDVMEVRPIYHHQKKDNVKGHIFVSFPALSSAPCYAAASMSSGGVSIPTPTPRPPAKSPPAAILPGSSSSATSPSSGPCASASTESSTASAPNSGAPPIVRSAPSASVLRPRRKDHAPVAAWRPDPRRRGGKSHPHLRNYLIHRDFRTGGVEDGSYLLAGVCASV